MFWEVGAFNPLKPRQNDNISLNESIWISIKISLIFFPWVQLTISSIGSENGLTPTKRQVIVWTNDG